MDFLMGGIAASCACIFSNPMDVIKTRQQLHGELMKRDPKAVNPYRSLAFSIKSIVKSEGLMGLQKGFASAVGFQFVMNSTRLGSYQTIDNYGLNRDEDNNLSPLKCIFWGGACGVLGTTFGCPFYMVKTQLQAQSFGEYAVGYQHQHKSMTQALVVTYREHGIKGLWHGYSSIVPRTAVGSSVQLATFSNCKNYLVNYDIFRESVFLTALGASFISGIFTCLFMTPFDVVATRMFNQGVDAQGKGLMYKGVINCFYKTFKVEGLHGLYKGFVPNYWRIAPHTLLNLTFWEKLKQWRNLYVDS